MSSCDDAQMYITPKDQSSTVLLDIQSELGRSGYIDIDYKDKNEPFTNKDVMNNITNVTITNGDDSIHTMDSLAIYPITIICRNSRSCLGVDIRIGSLDYLKLYCLSDESCEFLTLDFVSLDNDNRGELDVICRGQSACDGSKINAITTQRIGMYYL